MKLEHLIPILRLLKIKRDLIKSRDKNLNNTPPPIFNTTISSNSNDAFPVSTLPIIILLSKFHSIKPRRNILFQPLTLHFSTIRFNVFKLRRYGGKILSKGAKEWNPSKTFRIMQIPGAQISDLIRMLTFQFQKSGCQAWIRIMFSWNWTSAKQVSIK